MIKRNKSRVFAGVLAAALVFQPAEARPIVFAHSTTVMADYTEERMSEAQIFYAPKAFVSFGVGHMEIEGGGAHPEHKLSYFRVNLLAKRWNMESAQANVFLWGGADSAHMTQIVSVTATPVQSEHDHGARLRLRKPRTGEPSAPPGGMRADKSTSKPGASIRRSRRTLTTRPPSRTAWTPCNSASRPMCMTPMSWRPGSWSAPRATREMPPASHGGDQFSLLLRFFKKRMWVEAGATTDGKLQARAMFSL